MLWKYNINFTYTHRSGLLPGACVFSHETALLFHGPHEVCEGLLLLLLPQIIAKRAMKQILCRTRGATPSVPSIPSRRIEPRMKHVVKPWENCDILGHHGRTLGSAGVSIYIYICVCVCVCGVDGCVGKNPFRTDPQSSPWVANLY